ncbi:hypothetical protein GCM10010399_55420 [Dactylosporangium fulvum]
MAIMAKMLRRRYGLLPLSITGRGFGPGSASDSDESRSSMLTLVLATLYRDARHSLASLPFATGNRCGFGLCAPQHGE